METTATEGALAPRVRPTIRLGIALWIAYSVLAGVLQVRTGIPYTDWFKTASHALHTAVIPLTLGGLLLLAFTWWSRWDHVWRDPVRLRCTGLMKLSMLAWMAVIASAASPIERGCGQQVRHPAQATLRRPRIWPYQTPWLAR